jgi:predicted CopG family antitoxin
MTNPSTRREKLIEKLTAIQNSRPFWNVDILTITGAMSDDEVEKYVQDKQREAEERATKG